DLTAIAELSSAQVHKLVECGVCPAAEGVVQPEWYDEGSGARPWLRLFRRLSRQQQERVLSPRGLRLGEAAPEAVDEFLTTALTVQFGSAEKEDRADLVFSIQPGASQKPVLQLSVLRPGGRGFRQSLRGRLD